LIYYWEQKEKILYHNVLITDWIGSMSGAVNGLSDAGSCTWYKFRFWFWF